MRDDNGDGYADEVEGVSGFSGLIGWAKGVWTIPCVFTFPHVVMSCHPPVVRLPARRRAIATVTITASVFVLAVFVVGVATGLRFFADPNGF